LLNTWMDTRLVSTHAFDAPTDEERERPRMWRYWRALPPQGKSAMFFESWYTEPLLERVYGKLKKEPFDNSLEAIVRFEQMLVREGAQVLKFWFHLSQEAQRKRLKALERDPATRFRVTQRDWEHFERYAKFRRHAEQMLRQTSTAEAPWILVEGEDAYFRNLTAGRAVLSALQAGANRKAATSALSDAPPLLAPIDRRHVLDTLDLSQSLAKRKYEFELARLSGRLNQLMRARRFQKRHALVAVFEGNDAAGKGGSIRRVTAALDARQYHVVQTSAPSEEERAQPYLWRFVRQVPRRGRAALFDRSWYGRVLVERVEKLCSEADFLRAYSEINDFETELHEHGILVVKFWLEISQDEQLRRFREREQTGFKRYKITHDDYRNRGKWDDYVLAANDMIERTSTELAPWTLVEANDKQFARIKVMRTLVEALEAVL
jgi:polyphosphate:AMP phosphotransferase